MTTTDTLLALAARVEALTGPDRDIDTEILWHIDRKRFLAGYWSAASGMPRPLERMPSKIGGLGWVGAQCSAPAYTASLDAAMTLALPSWWLRLSGPLSPEAYGYSREEERIFRAGFDMIGAPYSVGASGTTLPLAIVAACLKGRARTTKGSSDVDE